MDRAISGSSSVFRDKLQFALDTFCVEQEKCTEKLREEVEAMFLQQQQNFAGQRPFDESFELSEQSFKIPVLLSEGEKSQTTYIFDGVNRELPIADDEDSFDPDAMDLGASESSSSSDMSMTTPCLSGTGTQQRNVQNRFVSTQPREWDWDKLVNKRALKFDSLKHFIHHNNFVFAMTLIIILNSGYIGVVAHNNMMTVMHRYDALEKKVRFGVKTPEWDVDLDSVFTLIFTVEIVLRVLGDELAFFFWRGLEVELDGPGPCGNFRLCIHYARCCVPSSCVAPASRHSNDSQPAPPEPVPHVHQVPPAGAGHPALHCAPHVGLYLALWPAVRGKHALSQWRGGVLDVRRV